MEVVPACTLFLSLWTICLITLLAILYSSFDYFGKREIPHEKPKIPLGSLTTSSSLPFLLWDLYKKGGKNKMYGFFILWKPAILVKEPEMIKHILVKQFSSFHDRGMYIDEDRDPLSGHLFALEGVPWRKLRNKLSPAFTAGRMKLMFPTILKFGDKLIDHISNHPGEEFECFKLMAKFSLSNIASTAFGIESDLFEENSEFMKIALKLNTPSFTQLLKSFLAFHLQGMAKLLHLKLTPKEIDLFYLKLINDAFTIRESSNIRANDFLQMLIELKNKGSIDGQSPTDDTEALTMNQVTAQAMVFILGGFETSALAMSWALYELALNPHIQSRLQSEIDTLDEWTFTNVMNLEYLDMVLNESLRKYPVVPFLIRSCNKDFQIPGSEIKIEKGMPINISILGLHRDPELFPDPEKFDPERFGANPPHEVKPYSFLPFGEGPRFCIGMRFGKMQSKMGVALLLKHFTIEPTEKTEIPEKLSQQTFQLVAKNGLILRFKLRNKNYKS